MFPRATLLFRYLIPDWWWDPGDPQFHSHLPTSSICPRPYTPTPTWVQRAQHPPQRPCGHGCPCLRSFSHCSKGMPLSSLPLGTSQEPLRAEAGPGGKIAR